MTLASFGFSAVRSGFARSVQGEAEVRFQTAMPPVPVQGAAELPFDDPGH
jgi:hypothetical protein